jgi:transcriptional regulator GlxA family with amidase domain
MPGMTAKTPDSRINWIVHHLQRHLAEPLPVAELARLVNLSESRFRSLFAAQIGVAPARYLQKLRLRRARILLERTFLSVKEVMGLAGYNDPSHFARDFRREHGSAPSEIRRAGDPQPASPSVDRPTHKRIGSPRARDPGRRVA